MDNREENSRNTEQDRVDNPVENTVSTMVETALSENKRERKKREKAEKKKNAAHSGISEDFQNEAVAEIGNDEDDEARPEEAKRRLSAPAG